MSFFLCVFQEHIGVPYQDVDKRAALVLHNDHKDGTILMVSLSRQVVWQGRVYIISTYIHIVSL